MSYEQLIREHDHIELLTSHLEQSCAGPHVDACAVTAARDDLKNALEHHLAHEDDRIYANLMLAGGKSAEAIVDFARTFAELRADWCDYLADWDAECIGADEEGFRMETSVIMARVRERTRAETDLIYPIALQAGAIRLRAR